MVFTMISIFALVVYRFLSLATTAISKWDEAKWSKSYSMSSLDKMSCHSRGPFKSECMFC